MSVATFQHTCTACKCSTKISTSWIDPSLYTDPEKASITHVWWCKSCREGQAVRLQFLPENDCVVLEQLPYNSIIGDKTSVIFANKKHQKSTVSATEQMLATED